MNLRTRRQRTIEVYTASLNDIMFFLLLFFLITSTLATPNVLKLLLPNAKGVQTVKLPVTISVTSDLHYAVNNTPVDPEQLEPMLKSLMSNQTDPTALLKVDKTIQVQNLVDLLDIGNRLKIKMVLATTTSK